MNGGSDPVLVDVVVVGAGIAGASVAWALSAGARVALVEMEPRPGMHATGRSAALLNETSGEPVVCRLAGRSRPFLESPPSGFVEHDLLRRRGLLWVADADAAPLLATIAARAPHAASVLSVAEARAIVPTLADHAVSGGAVYEHSAATIDVAVLLEGYVRGLRRNGGVLLTTTEMVGAARRSGSWVVTAGPRMIEAEIVVDAAGAWGDVVAARAGVVPLGLRPMRRTAALAATSSDVSSWPMIMDVGGAWYAEPEAGGLLISPADETPCDPGDASAEEIDVALALERVNAALGVQLRSVRRAWVGLRTFAPDRVPVAGPDPEQPTFIWLVGQGGAGIKTAPALAEIVADRVLAGTPVPDELSPARLR